MDLRYESLATGRTTSLFAEDMRAQDGAIRDAIRRQRVAVAGAAGSIGSSVVKTLLRFEPGALVLLDLNENNLVELVRDLRSTPGLHLPGEFATLPIGLGSVEFERFFAESPPFDYFLNLAALKHVRSERNIYCLMRMVDTNVLFLHDFLARRPRPFRKVFSVSSDKATHPANLMGATKMIMEKALLHRAAHQPFSTARFANVAFSDGSLPYGFLQRLSRRQPLSAPRDVRRYFITHQEAGELCVLSCMVGHNRDVFFPKLAEGLNEKTFAQIARDLLHALGYEPLECRTEDEARRRAAALGTRPSAWPCYFFDSDTTGEKAFEEFVAAGETTDLNRFRNIGVIVPEPDTDAAALEAFLEFARAAKRNPEVTKADYVREMRGVVPTLQHHETEKNLDQKM
ncbi:MAG: polysaccharide biosynthesis protein [Verrucomicrobia bacterium]|nr:polysaccharide biosynthesis protein [Verrucomicrobiota bacterium]